MPSDLNAEAPEQGVGPGPKKPPGSRLAQLKAQRQSRQLAGAPAALGLAPPPALPLPRPEAPPAIAPADVSQVATPSQLEMMRTLPPLPISEARPPRMIAPVTPPNAPLPGPTLAPKVAPTPTPEPPAAVGPATPGPTLEDRLRAVPVVGSHLASIGERVAGTALKFAGDVAPANLSLRLQQAGLDLQQQGQQHQEQERLGRSDWPAAARIPSDALDIATELEAGGELPGIGRVLRMAGPERRVAAELGETGEVTGTRVFTRGGATIPERIVGRAGTEATRFATLEGAKAAAQGESPSDILRETIAGATGGAAFGVAGGAASEGFSALVERGLMREARLNLPEQPTQSYAEPGLASPETQRLLAPPGEGSSVMPDHVREAGLRQALQLAQPPAPVGPPAIAPPPARPQIPRVAQAAQEKELAQTPPYEQSFAAKQERERVPEKPTLEEFMLHPEEHRLAADYREQLRARAAAETPTGPVGVQELPAYHGSPHRFDEFKQEAIGTGQGAASYGHGFYFAENPKVARSYRPVDRSSLVRFHGEDIGRGYAEPKDMLARWGVPAADQAHLIDALDLVSQFKGVKEALGFLSGSLQSIRDNPKAFSAELRGEYEDRQRALRRYGKDITTEAPGALYTTKLNVEPHELLDWDKPAMQQPPVVKKALTNLGLPVGGAFEVHPIQKQTATGLAPGYVVRYRTETGSLLLDKDGAPVDWGEYRAEHMGQARAEELNRSWSNSTEALYRILSERLGGQEQASAALREHGVKGIRYLDQGSRGATGKQTRNYVIFDARDIATPVRVEAAPALYGEPEELRGEPPMEIVFPAESVASGTFGFVPKLAGAPADVLERLSADLDTQAGPEETAIAGDLVGNQWATTETRGFGMWRGQVNPNVVTRVPLEAGSEYAGALAAVRGLVRGQDYQIWWRRMADAEPGGTGGYVVRSRGRPITSEDFRQLEQIVGADPELTPVDGATLAGDHILFLNRQPLPQDQFQELVENAIKQLPEELDLESRSFRFQLEEFNGPRDFLKRVGRRPDALRRVADLFTRVARPAYERAAVAVGEDPAVASERLEAHARFLRSAADAAASTASDIRRAFAELRPESSRTNLEVAKLLAKSGRPSLENAPRPQQMDRLIRKGMADLRDAVRLFKSAGAWWDLDIQRAHALALSELPRTRELAYRTIFDAVVAVIANGNEVQPNWESALAVMRNFDRTGRLSLYKPETRVARLETRQVRTTIQGKARRVRVTKTKVSGEFAEGVRGHERQQTHELGLSRLDALVQEQGLAGAAQELLKAVPRGPQRPELVPQFYHLVGTDPIKIASMFANLVGMHDFVTVDQWMQKWLYQTLGFVRTIPGRELVNGRWRASGEDMLDQQPKATEASLMREAIRAIATRASGKPSFGGQPFTPASVQALIWYLEKYRYHALGSAQGTPIGFSEAAANMLWGPPQSVGVMESSHQMQLELDVPEVEQAFGTQAAADEAIDRITDAWKFFQGRSEMARQVVAELQGNRAAVWLGKQIPTQTRLRKGMALTQEVPANDAAQHVAQMLQTIRSPFAETMAMLGVKDGQVVLAHFVTSGDVDFVMLSQAMNDEAGPGPWQDFLEEAQRLGVQETWSAHNHPSGEPTPSGEGGDLSAFRWFRRTATKYGIAHAGDLIIDDDTFTMTTQGHTSVHAYASSGRANWLDPHPFPGPGYVMRADDVATFIRHQTDRPGLYAVMTGAAGKIVGIEHYPPLTSLQQVRTRVIAQATRLGASSVFLAAPPAGNAATERSRYTTLLNMVRNDPALGRLVRDIVLFAPKKGVHPDAADALIVHSAVVTKDLDQHVWYRAREEYFATRTGVRVEDSATSLEPWPNQPGYVTDPVVGGSRSLQTPLGGVERGVPASWRQVAGPMVGEDGLPRASGFILQDSLSGGPYGVTPQAETTIGKLLTAFAGTRLEQIGPALHYLLVDYERQRAALSRDVSSDIIRESLERAAVDFVARLPYFDTPRAVTLLSYLRDKLPRAIGRKLGVTPDRQRALFDAAEAIVEFDEKGQPVFRDVRERSGELDDVGLAQLDRIYGSPAKLEAELGELEAQREQVREQRERDGLRPTDAAVARFVARRRAKVDQVKLEDRQLVNRVKAERDAALQTVRILKMADLREVDDPDAAAAMAQDLREAEQDLARARDRVAHVEGVVAGRGPLGAGLRGEDLPAALQAIDQRQQTWRDLSGQLGELGEARKTRRSMLGQYKRATKAREPGAVRVTAEEARTRWQALTSKEQDVVRRFAIDSERAHRHQLSAHVNRQLAKLEYDVSSDIEAYVHHYGFLDEGAVSQFFGSELRRKHLIAPAKQRRAGVEGFKRHLEGARLHGGVPLALAQLHNEFAETFEQLMLANPDPNLARPLRAAEQAPSGFRTTEEGKRRIAFKTLAAGEEAPPGFQVKAQPDGTRFASRVLDTEEPAPEGMTRVQGRFGAFQGKAYAIANPIYREFEFFTQKPPAALTTDPRANRLWEFMKDKASKAIYYWSLNQLLSLGTYMRNLYSGVAQMSGTVAEAIARGDLHATQKYILSLARALSPQQVRALPYTEFGGNGATMRTLDEAHGIFRAFMTTALMPMGIIENYLKRALTLATRELEAERVADEMVQAGTIGRDARKGAIRNLYANPTADIRVAEEAVRDAFAFNYNNTPLALRKMRKSVIGKALVPFPVYGYKLARLYGRYAGAAGRIAIGKARRGDLNKLLAALLVFGLPAVVTWLGDEKGKARTTDPGAGVKYDFDRSGRAYIGLNDKGLEEWLLTQSYGTIGLSVALGHAAHDRSTIELRNYLSSYLSVGPGFQLADQVRQVRNRYQAYRNNSAILGDFARSWIPFHRPLESVTHMVDPTKRKQETFVQALLYGLPVPEQDLQQVGLTRGEPRAAKGNRELVPPYDPWLQFLQEFGGINIKLIDPSQAEDEYRRAARRAQTADWRDQVKRRRLRALEDARNQRQQAEEP